jgi:parvulin-like peptidyl-prolyl isomerase
MTGGVNAQVAAPLLAQQPTDEQLRAYYDAHRAKYTADGSMNVRDLVLHIGGYENADQSMAQAKIDATEAVYQLRSGASADYVMEHFGFNDSGRMRFGNEPDFAAKLHLGPTLYPAATRLTEGQVSDPVADTDGLHVLIMEQRRMPTIADFASARTAVYADYREDIAKAAQHENVKILRGQAQIILAPGESE